MLRNWIAMSALGLLLIPAVSQAVVEHDYGYTGGNWELTLSGVGTNDSSFRGVNLSAEGSLGYFFNNNLEVAVRQTGGFTDVGIVGKTPATSWVGSTDAAIDWHFDLGQWQPFVGGNVGFLYGDGQHNTWEAAPEAGLKYFLTTSAFVFFRAEYQFFFDKVGTNSLDTFKDGRFLYTLGLGVKL